MTVNHRHEKIANLIRTRTGHQTFSLIGASHLRTVEGTSRLGGLQFQVPLHCDDRALPRLSRVEVSLNAANYFDVYVWTTKGKPAEAPKPLKVATALPAKALVRALYSLKEARV